MPELVPVPAQVPLPEADGLLLAGLVEFDARAADDVSPWLKRRQASFGTPNCVSPWLRCHSETLSK
ncbi:MerC protein [Rhodovulum sulfidophilum]|uniref:MerC protein n=1 Tax=Rhodovulum sulfidophilum TaxID=35806 RepID=A0A0D6B2K6_RHOSU|nr:MerC protein [Rhodovulum sulfidophilum]